MTGEEMRLSRSQGCRQLLRVSMTWYTTLANLSSLWTHLDLATTRQVPINTIRDYVRRSKDGLTRASVCTSKSRHDMMLCDALLRCPTLKHLDINIDGAHDRTLLNSIPYFAGLQVLVLSGHLVLPFERVMMLLGSCKTLTRAEFHRVEGSIENMEWTSNVSIIRSLAITGNTDENLKVKKLKVTLGTWVSCIFRPIRM